MKEKTEERSRAVNFPHSLPKEMNYMRYDMNRSMTSVIKIWKLGKYW